MEYVSVLAGARFNDHPRCTHPALATLARLVNDEIHTDNIRNQLALLAPDLAAIGRHDVRITPTITATCVQAASNIATTQGRALPPLRQRLTQLDRRTKQLGPGGWARRLARLAQTLNIGPFATTEVRSAFRAFNNQLRNLTPEERDVLLYLLLVGAITRCRRTGRAEQRTDRSGWSAGARRV